MLNNSINENPVWNLKFLKSKKSPTGIHPVGL
jgi:hypothetical protein